MRSGGFGGISGLEKKRQYKAMDAIGIRSNRYNMVFDKGDIRGARTRDNNPKLAWKYRDRSLSPRRDRDDERRRTPRDSHGEYWRGREVDGGRK